MPNCVRCPRNRARPNRKRVQRPRRLRKMQVLQPSPDCSGPTKKWRNTCALTLRNCSTTCSTHPAISCTTVSPCPTAGTEHKVPKSGKTRPNEPGFRTRGRMNVGCWKRQCCFQQPHDCIRTPPHTSVFAHISLIYGRFGGPSGGISLIYGTLAW